MSEALKRVPPQDLDAERALLSAMMSDADRIAEVAPLVKPCDFHLPSHRVIAETLVKMNVEGISVDLVTLQDRLKRAGQLDDIGGSSYLVEVFESSPSAANAEHYARTVAAYSLQRRTLLTLHDGIRRMYEAKSPRVTLGELLTNLGELDTADKPGDMLSVSQATAELAALDGADKGPPCARFPIIEVDSMLGGLQGGQQVVIAGRTSSGKTILGLQIALRAASDGLPVLIFSMEMLARTLATRMLSQLAGFPVAVKHGRLSFPTDRRSDAHQARVHLDGLPITICQVSGIGIDDIAARAHAAHRRGQCELVIIDYLQLLRTPQAESHVREIEMISRGCKLLATGLGIPVVLLSQLSRQVDSRGEWAKPRLGDLKWSGSIEQDADVVLLIHRTDPDSQDVRTRQEGAILVAKNRNGPVGEVPVRFDEAALKFDRADI